MFTALHSWSFRDRFKSDPDFTIEKAIDITADMGFGGIEIMSGKAGGPWDDFASDDVAYLKGVVKYAADRGVRVLSLATYNDFAFVKNEEWRLANIQYIKDWLGKAADVGVPNIRMLTGYYIEGEDRARLEKLTLDGIRECVPVAERVGVNMAIENHNTIFVSAKDLLWLRKELGSERITFCPDPTNWVKDYFKGNDTQANRESIFEQLKMLAPRATQSHLKIGGVKGDELVGLDSGALDRLIRIYKDAGYDGAITFESVTGGDLLAQLPDAKRIVDAAIARA